MKYVLSLFFFTLSVFSLSAQDGNVGVGTTNPQAKLHVNGGMIVEDTLKIKDPNGNDHFIFDPDSVQFILLDQAGDAFFTLGLEDGSANAKHDKNTSNTRSGQNTFAWTFDSSSGTEEKRFDSQGNGTLIEGKAVTGADGFSTSKTFKDANNVVRRTLEVNGIVSEDEFNNSLGQLQLRRTMDATNVILEYFTPPDATNPTNKIVLDKGSFLIENIFGVTLEAQADLLELTNSNGDKSVMGIGSTTVKEGTDMAELNETGIAQVDNTTGEFLFVDKFGFSKLGQTSDELASVDLDATAMETTVVNDLCVTGDLKVNGTKNFRIDHPLDPKNKFLNHSAIESPAPLNLYRGNAITNTKGIAEIYLPDYFQVLNIDYTYHLTVIGSFAQAIVLEEINNNVFTIQTTEPSVKVSWQVIGQRNDPYFQDKPFIAEQEKTGKYKGQLLYDPNRQGPFSAGARKHWQMRQEYLQKAQNFMNN
ncbi:MAG: hypothetical protein AAGA77_00185 [Bacteroidota bacterium]